MKLAPFLLLAFVLLLPTVHAQDRQNDWRIDTTFKTGTELAVTQIIPPEIVPLGGEFRIAVNAWTDVAATDTLEMGLLRVSAGCRIITSTIDNSGSPLDLSINSESILQIIDTSCHWRRSVWVNDTVQGNVAQVQAVGTVVAYQANTREAAPSLRGVLNEYGGAVFWMAVTLALLIFGAWLPATVTTIGALAQWLEMPIGPAGIALLLLAAMWLHTYSEAINRAFKKKE